MLGFAFTLQSLPPVLTLIIEDLGLTHTQAGLLMSLFALPPVFTSIFTGFFSDRLGPYRVGIISFVFMIFGVVTFAFSNSFFQAGVARVVAGIGASTLAIVSAKLVSQWFGGREIGTAMGIFNTAMPVGTIICFSTFGNIGERLGWRMVMFIVAAVGVVGLLGFLTIFKSVPGESKRRDPAEKRRDAKLLLNLLSITTPVWMIGLCWMWFNAAVISFSTFAPDYFISRGATITLAGVLVSLLMWGSLVLSPVIGRLVDKLGNNDIFIGAGGLLLGISIYLVTKVERALFPMAVMSFAVAFVPAPVFSFPAKVLRQEILGLVFGLYFMMSSLGMFFGPYVAGFVRDKSGMYETSFVLLSVIALLITLTALISIKAMRNKSSESL
jgi:predicted MFS family arabinose efflux permease